VKKLIGALVMCVVLVGSFAILMTGCGYPTEPTDVATGTQVSVSTVRGDGSQGDTNVDVDVDVGCDTCDQDTEEQCFSDPSGTPIDCDTGEIL
jgi:hypothetical protein